jgi:predicted ester cyclase
MGVRMISRLSLRKTASKLRLNLTTGKQVTVSGLTISRLEGGKIVEEFQNWDTFGMMQQLGAVPALAHA